MEKILFLTLTGVVAAYALVAPHFWLSAVKEQRDYYKVAYLAVQAEAHMIENRSCGILPPPTVGGYHAAATL